jgi:hypothetical protein
LRLVDGSEVQVAATESRWVSVQLRVPYDAAPPGSHPIHFNIDATDPSGQALGHLKEKTVFLMPR